MSDPRFRLRNAHPAVLFIFLAVFWGVGTWALGFLTGSSSFAGSSLIIRGLGAIVFAAVMTFVIVRRRARNGGVQTSSAIDEAIRTGVVPEGVATDAWGPILLTRETALNRSRWFNPIFFALFTALGIYLIASGGSGATLGWLCTVFFIAIGAYSVVVANRQLRRIKVLLESLP